MSQALQRLGANHTATRLCKNHRLYVDEMQIRFF